MNDDRSGGVPPAGEAPPPQQGAAKTKNGGGWQMPEPKFQQTSGYLPQGYLGSVGLEGPPAASPASPNTSPDVEVPPLPGIDIEPQPGIAEVLADGPSVAPQPTAVGKEKSTGTRVVLLVLGLLGMVAFIAVFLIVVYYLFINPQNSGSTF